MMPTEQADRGARVYSAAGLGRELRTSNFLLALMAAAAEPLEGLSAAEWKAEYLRRHEDVCQMMDRAIAAEARVGELEGALKPLLSCLDDIETYQRRPERGDWDVECACCMGEMFEPEEYAAMEKARALLTPPAPHSDEART